MKDILYLVFDIGVQCSKFSSIICSRQRTGMRPVRLMRFVCFYVYNIVFTLYFTEVLVKKDKIEILD